jgi:hypothetical protein
VANGLEHVDDLGDPEPRCSVCGRRLIRLRMGMVSGRFHPDGPHLVCPVCDNPDPDDPGPPA